MDLKKVYFIMPFGDRFFEIFELIKRKYGSIYEFSHSAENQNQQNIVNDIIHSIYESDIIIANLTDLNPNVFYELGIAHAFNKKVIIITEDILSLPFDLKTYRAKQYSMDYLSFDSLLEFLQSSLEGAFNGNISFSNPVMDYFNIKGTKSLSFSTMDTDKVLNIDDSEKGFIDFLADIQNNIKIFTSHLIDMAADMNKMTENTTLSTSKIEETKSSRSGKTASIIQHEIKKIAGFMSSFDNKLQKYNKDYVAIWDEIESDILGLIENDYSQLEQNKLALVEFLKSLLPLKKSIVENKETMINLSDSLNNNIGIERTMTQAIKILLNDLKTYITILDQIYSSIDRIHSKSRLVVGEIS